MLTGASAVVFNSKNQVLLIKRKDLDAWSYPGGRKEDYESLEECCLRELREETGIEAKISFLSGIYIRTIPFFEDINFVFKCAYEKGELAKQNNEVVDVNWFNVDSLPAPMVTYTTDIIKNTLYNKNRNMDVKFVNRNDFWLIKKFILHRIKKLFKKALSSR